MFFGYVLFKYLKNFILIIFSLSFFYLIIDLVANYSSLPDSSNLIVLYVYYVFASGMDVFYSLSLVFAFLITLYYMIKFNELVSFYASGFLKRKMLVPFLFLGVVVMSVFISLESTKYAYYGSYADSILSNKQYTDTNLFIKYKNKVVFIKKLNPVLKIARNIKIFYIKNGELTKIVSAQKAYFINDEWKLINANVTEIKTDKLNKYTKTMSVLKNFKPKIISNLKNINSISLYDAFQALNIFKDVNLNTIKSIILFKILTPLCMIALMSVFLITSPLHQRISNVSFFLVKSVILSIIIWGVHLMIYKFAKQGVVSPYVMFLPFLITLTYFLYLTYKEK